MTRIRFLVIDDDPDVYELISQHIFTDGKLECLHAIDGEEGLRMVEQHQPDLILLDLVMPGLSGQDVLVGLKQKNYSSPIIVSTKRGTEQKAIEAFRLGATDFITMPLRPPELLASVERALEEVRLRREKADLLARLQASNQALEERVKHLTLLSTMGNTLNRMRSIDELYDGVLSSAIEMTRADHATLMIKDLDGGKLRLVAGKNLTLVMQEKLGENIKDDLADLILTSRQPLVAAGEGLQRFKLSREIRAVVYVPLLAHENPVGVLTVGNHKKKNEFDDHHAQVLNVLADYAAIGITNARLFSALDLRARNTESALNAKDAQRLHLLTALEQQVKVPLRTLIPGLAGQPALQSQFQDILQRLENLTEMPATSTSSRTIQRI